MSVDKVAYASVTQTEKNAELPELPIQKLPRGWGTRHTQAFLFFISLSVGYSMRAQLSVSIVAMTSNSTLQMWYPNISTSCLYPAAMNMNYSYKYQADTKRSIENNTQEDNLNRIYKSKLKFTSLDNSEANETYSGRYSGSFITNTSLKQSGDQVLAESVEDKICSKMKEDFAGWTVYRVYKWDKPTQELIQFSFFFGYTCMMMPMALIAQKFGGKVTLMIALGSNGVLSLLTPWLPILGGWLGVAIFRFFQGLTQSAFYPSIHSMLGKWAPLSERGTLGAYIYTGSQFGTVVAFQLAGLFAGSPALGWPVTFWFCGVVSLVCLGVLAKLGAASPYEHPNISSEEFLYVIGGSNADSKPKERRTPWKHILTCPAIWGIISAHAGSAFSYIYILTQVPIYMSKVLNVDIKNNGLFSSLPYIFMYLSSISFGYITDWLIKKQLVSVVNIRRFANSFGMVLPAIFLVAFCYVKSTLAAVILLVLCLSTHSGVHVGFHINSIDLAPNFAGPIMALGNMIANLFSLTIPVMVSTIVGDDTANQYKWQILVYVVAAVKIVTNLIFVVFARGTVQPWNFHDQKDDSQQESINKTKEMDITLARLSLVSQLEY